MLSNSGTQLTMPVAPAYANSGFGGGFGDGIWIWVFLIFALFGGWGNGFGNNSSGAMDNYVLTSDFSQLSRQISDATSMTERKLDSVTNGICSLGYDQLAQMNGINSNIATQGYETRNAINGIGTQLADCCCQTKTMIADVNYNLASQANAITNAVTSGFCQTNYNNATNTRDIIDSQNAGTRAILDAINANKVEALNQKIAEQNQQISALQLAASQEAQNNYLVSKLQPTPVPAFSASSLYGYYGNCGCGCN